MKKKIIFFHLLNNFTGSPQVLRSVIEVAKEKGLDVHLYTSSGEGFLSGITGISYHRNYYLRSRFRLLTLFTFFISQFFLGIKLLSRRSENCSFYVNTILPFSAIWMGKMLQKEVIVHVHEYAVSPRLLNRFLFWVVRSYADQLIVVSRFLGDNPSLRPRESKVIYNAVSDDFARKAKQKLTADEEFRVLMLASLRPYKGIYEYLTLARENPSIVFDLILSDSEDDVARWKVNQDTPSNLAVVSVQKDVTPWFEKASVVLNLSHKDKWLETFGMTILEGMHFGLPAIVPTAGGISELIDEGKNGFLIDYTDLSKISALLKRMKTEPDFYSPLSVNAFATAGRFSSGSFKKQIFEVLP